MCKILERKIAKPFKTLKLPERPLGKLDQRRPLSGLNFITKLNDHNRGGKVSECMYSDFSITSCLKSCVIRARNKHCDRLSSPKLWETVISIRIGRFSPVLSQSHGRATQASFRATKSKHFLTKFFNALPASKSHPKVFPLLIMEFKSHQSSRSSSGKAAEDGKTNPDQPLPAGIFSYLFFQGRFFSKHDMRSALSTDFLYEYRRAL